MTMNVGRPRSKNVDSKIIEATKQLLAHTSPDALSIEAIAKQAGVGKASIYRRYKNKNQIVLAALSEIKSIDLNGLDISASASASASAIFYEIADRFLTAYNNPAGRQAIMTIVNATASGDQLSNIHAMNETQKLTQLIQELQTQAKLPQALDPSVTADTLISIFMGQFLLAPQAQVAASLRPILAQLFSTWE